MTAWLWLILAAIAFVIWALRVRRRRDDDLGSVRARWLHECRRHTRTGEEDLLRFATASDGQLSQRTIRHRQAADRYGRPE